MDEGSRQALALQKGLEGQWHDDGLCTGSAYPLGFPAITQEPTSDRSRDSTSPSVIKHPLVHIRPAEKAGVP